MSVVKFASSIVLTANLYPRSTELIIDLPDLSSSLILSKTRTLASTAIPIVSTMPAIPGIVSVASMRLSNEINKIILNIIAKSAIKPNTLYLIIINNITSTKPILRAFFPALIESSPRLGPTVLSSKTVIGAGNEPALSNTAKSFAVSGEKFPLIFPCPPVMGSRIWGALITLPSRRIASR